MNQEEIVEVQPFMLLFTEEIEDIPSEISAATYAGVTGTTKDDYESET